MSNLKRYIIDEALTYDSFREGGEPGVYVVDAHCQILFCDVIARFLSRDRAVEYCDMMNDKEHEASRT